MGQSSRLRTIDWAWLQSLGAMIEGGAEIRIICQKCGRIRDLSRDDLERLAEKVGRDYRLINRRTRCRLKPGCDGWNRPYYLLGVYRPMWDEAHAVNHWRG